MGRELVSDVMLRVVDIGRAEGEWTDVLAM